MGLLSICLYSIGLNKASVEFYFRYSGLIAVILAQVILLLSLFSSSIVIKLYPQSYFTIYAGDQVRWKSFHRPFASRNT